MRVLIAVRGRVMAATFVICLLAGGWVARPAMAQSAAGAAPQQTIEEKIAASKELLDINTATAAQLKALPGMGDAYAQRIIAGRPYTMKNQLLQRGILLSRHTRRSSS